MTSRVRRPGSRTCDPGRRMELLQGRSDQILAVPSGLQPLLEEPAAERRQHTGDEYGPDQDVDGQCERAHRFSFSGVVAEASASDAGVFAEAGAFGESGSVSGVASSAATSKSPTRCAMTSKSKSSSEFTDIAQHTTVLTA